MKWWLIIMGGTLILGKTYISHCREQWYLENYPIGKQLGYPDCCIKEFCDAAPELIPFLGVPNGRLRYDAACVNGEYTGFIPCAYHARKILDGEITIESLISNRDPELAPFPMI